MLRRKDGQSIVEYAILLGVVIAALLIMQLFIKRSYQGNLKDSADKMGDQFSASGTTTSQDRDMTTNQTIIEGVATSSTIDTYRPAQLTEKAEDVVGGGVYSYSKRKGGKSTTTMQSKTDSAGAEKTRASDFTKDKVADFTFPADD